MRISDWSSDVCSSDLLYGEALALEPNDPGALAGQGEALVERGAVERAKRNLERLKTVCKAPCPQATTLAAVIAKGPPPEEIGSQSWRETVGKYVKIPVCRAY